MLSCVDNMKTFFKNRSCLIVLIVAAVVVFFLCWFGRSSSKGVTPEAFIGRTNQYVLYFKNAKMEDAYNIQGDIVIKDISTGSSVLVTSTQSYPYASLNLHQVVRSTEPGVPDQDISYILLDEGTSPKRTRILIDPRTGKHTQYTTYGTRDEELYFDGGESSGFLLVEQPSGFSLPWWDGEPQILP